MFWSRVYLFGRRQLDVSGGFSGCQHTLSGSFKVLAVNTSATKQIWTLEGKRTFLGVT